MHFITSRRSLLMTLLTILAAFGLNACSHTADEAVDSSVSKPVDVSQAPPDRKTRQQSFFNTLRGYCGERFIGQSSFPDDPKDSFYGKTLNATFLRCSDTEIRVPFSVGDDHSRTWIFTMTEQGLQLKHQHLHKDGTPDEVSNYGGMAKLVTSKNISDTTGRVETTISFPADDFTKTLLPEAATNVWSITLSKDATNRNDTLTYYLTRHDKPRFKATLKHSDIKL